MIPLFILSWIMGCFYGLVMSCISLLFVRGEALEVGLMSGGLFTALLFVVLVYVAKKNQSKYEEFEKQITSKVFYKVNGNFNLGHAVQNGNIYFCEEGIIFASFDGKKFITEEVWLSFVEKYEFDNVHMNIYTKDGRKFLVTTKHAPVILEILKNKKWIE